MKIRAILCVLSSTLFYSFLFHSCQTTNDKSKTTYYMDSITFTITDERLFSLDTDVTPNTISVDIFPKSKPEYLFYNHRQANKISIFEIKTGNLVSKITLHPEGPNGVGDDSMTGIYVHNFDSLFFLSLLKQQLYLIDTSANVVNKYSLLTDLGYTQLGTGFPAFMREDNLYFSTYPSPMNPITSRSYGSGKLNLVTKELKMISTLSSTYDQGSWGRHHYLRINQAYNPSKDFSVVSYPNDHYLHIYKEDQLLFRRYAGARMINDLRPLADNISELDDNATFKIEAYQGSYSSVFYDRFQNLYYRFAFNPIGRMFESARDTEKNVSIIILNDRFEKVGEYYLEQNTYSLGAIFITEQGLFILNRKKYESGNEDKIPFDRFTIKTILKG